jgi:hypothetical protein
MPKQRQQQNDRERYAQQPQQCASATSDLSLLFSCRLNGIVELLFRPLAISENDTTLPSGGGRCRWG